MKYSILILFMLFAASCTFTPVQKNIDLDIPEDFHNSQVMIRDSVVYNEWWKVLENDELNNLVELGINQNLDIKLAVSRVRQFEAIFDLSSSQKLPTATISNQESLSYLPNPQGGDHEEQFKRTLNLGLSYTLDIWGKIASQTKAANTDFIAMKYDLQRGYDQIISTIIKIYFDIKSSQKRLQLLKESYNVYKEHTELQNERYINGIGSDLNVYLSEQEVTAAKRDVIREEQKLLSYKYELSVLLGKYPNESLITDSLVSFDDVQAKLYVPFMIPSELLKQKPELKYYEYKLESARHNAGAVKAERFPQVTLSASFSLSDSGIEDLFDFEKSLTSSLSKQGSKILYAGGSQGAKENQSMELYEQAFLNYKKAILNAFKDTENLLAEKESIGKELIELKKQFEYSEQILILREDNYLQGIGRYDDFINAQKSHFNLSGNLINTENNFIKAYINLFSHIGGIYCPQEKLTEVN